MLRLCLVVLATLFIVNHAYAGDGWQGRPSVCATIPAGPRADRCHYWVQTVQRPDIPGASCCGEADAYIVNWDVEGGKLIMTIVADYPPPPSFDEEGNSVAPPAGAVFIKKGTRIEIPPEKMVTRIEDANQSPNSVLFMNMNLRVFCAILGPLF